MRIASFEQREWINPWNDRRPMTDDWVIVTVKDRWHKYVSMSKYDEDGWFNDEDEEVIAWMPLPDPAESLIDDVKAYVREHYDGEKEISV